MKKIFAGMLVVMGLLQHNTQAQVSVQVNIGAQPVWGPVGYDYVEYYYMPDIEVYYWVPRHQYVYLSNGRWIFAAGLPARFRSYNVYNGYKVVINEPRPYLRFKQHKVKYAGYRGGRQVIIRDSRDAKYYVVKGHPNYKSQGHKGGYGNGKKSGYGNGKGKGKKH